MRNFSCIFVFISLFCLVSCKKEDTNANPDPAASRVKTYTEDHTSGLDRLITTFNLNYDSKDRLLNMVSAATAGDRFQFSYDQNTVTMEQYNANELSIHILYFLQPNNLVDSTIQYNDTNDFSSERFFYNSQNQVTKHIEYDYYGPIPEISNVSDYTFTAEGNISQVKDRYSLTTYDYFTNYSNAPEMGFPSFPKSKNLVKTTTITYGYTPQVWNHTYTFDSKKRLTSETINSSTGEIIVKSYTY